MTIHQVRDKQITGTPMATCKTLINNTRSRGHLCRIVMGLIISVTSYNDWWVGDLWSFLTKVRASATVSLCVSVSVVIEKKLQKAIHQKLLYTYQFFESNSRLNKLNILKYNRGYLQLNACSNRYGNNFFFHFEYNFFF